MVKVAAVSGYKAYELGIYKPDDPASRYIKAALYKQIESLIEEGLQWVVISGQPGVELWAAEAVFELQNLYPELKLSIITPFLNQEEKWSDKNKEWYESILYCSDHVDSVTRKPYEKPWQLKAANEFIVKKTDALILLYDMEKEGTPKYLYEAAKKHQENTKYDIRLIGFYDLQQLVEEEAINNSDY
ncbi:DUF1273 domain-containing protein [Bacillus massilinigeriensis]|uniref:DUF1273 domain-containing protein n=1 Tax=Bacillus mediterraneensis TaxID=1805474 RepID=UPI0008F803A0|nr:DUF1273 domain-containing protein [Bacillus mediterraneensis]